MFLPFSPFYRRPVMIQNKQFGCIAKLLEMSNVGGEIDTGAPREVEGYGWETSGSQKRKLRDQIEDHRTPLAQALFAQLGIDKDELEKRFNIAESRHRNWHDISELESRNRYLEMIANEPAEAQERFWDNRTFGRTSLSKDEKDGKKNDKKDDKKNNNGDNSVRGVVRGCVQFQPSKTILPITTILDGLSKKAPLRKELLSPDNPTGDLGPGAIKLVNHAVYFTWYIIDANQSFHTKADDRDIDLLKMLIRGMHSHDASASRTGTHIVMAFHATHASVMPSFNEFDFIRACTPKAKGDPTVPSQSFDEYIIPTMDEIRAAMSNQDIEIEDLIANGNGKS
tara:strand:+ start:5938 stop:6954 length:1017 start_codon:yes stop_codon:yes gene_type:complete